MSVRDIKRANLIKLALTSMKQYVAKSKEIKGDVILERLMDSDEVMIDASGQFVVTSGDAGLEFVSVDSVLRDRVEVSHYGKKQRKDGQMQALR